MQSRYAVHRITYRSLNLNACIFGEFQEEIVKKWEEALIYYSILLDLFAYLIDFQTRSTVWQRHYNIAKLEDVMSFYSYGVFLVILESYFDGFWARRAWESAGSIFNLYCKIIWCTAVFCQNIFAFSHEAKFATIECCVMRVTLGNTLTWKKAKELYL